MESLRDHVAGQKYSVALNGVKTHEFLGERGTAGFIGIQSHSRPSIVKFRYIGIKELVPPKTGDASDE